MPHIGLQQSLKDNERTIILDIVNTKKVRKVESSLDLRAHQQLGKRSKSSSQMALNALQWPEPIGKVKRVSVSTNHMY